ncbi:MAG: cysteine--tRNA ligase [Candidatus Abyssobacteria bacterium SURF_17]|uniref:Cysteine--tRNA ligase n=1 Tax=Candidatus Abyssobacteria bacterium SURF_17 TaxID=2093361 RepID=A0A419ERB6_9BACT|nr:MAG: cysteine--tRNA ligase [Candidatus Abyssubacteria bacterium SURF_17]
MQVYNTLTRTKEPLQPIKPGKVSIYTCGPTVYNFIHIGNARVFVMFDVVRRYLRFRGYRVKYVQNLTDVDDKIINKAKEEGVSASEVAEKYIHHYFEDADALGIQRADYHPRATDFIPEMVSLIEKLLEKGFAYRVNGDIFFEISKFKEYGQLSHQNLEELMEGVRIDVDPRLRHPLDFALWKSAKPGEPSWDSPWGKGRPGWHIECSVMSSKYLGEEFDIHCGGHDLIFPHHENEIAQSRAATGKEFARVWLHNGYLNIGGQKMSKSLGNITLVRELLKTTEPEAIRHFLLSAHYRRPLDFNEDSFSESESALKRVYTALDKAERQARLLEKRTARPASAEISLEDIRKKLAAEFEEAMDDDFNTPKALAAFFNMVRDLNKILDGAEAWKCSPDELHSLAQETRRLGAVLGLFQRAASGADTELSAKLLDMLITLRAEARARKDFALADAIRSRLADLGIALEDTPDGTFWRMK